MQYSKTRIAVFASLAFGTAATAASFYAPLSAQDTRDAHAGKSDLSAIYPTEIACDKDGNLVYTFILTKQGAELADLHDDAVPKYKVVESDKEAFERRVRMIRAMDTEIFRPSAIDTEKAWKKVEKYTLNPCGTLPKPRF